MEKTPQEPTALSMAEHSFTRITQLYGMGLLSREAAARLLGIDEADTAKLDR